MLDCINKYPQLSAKQLKLAVVGKLNEAERFTEANQAAEMLANEKRIAYLRGKTVDVNAQVQGKHSFKAVAEIKKGTDKLDQFLIYKINSKNLIMFSKATQSWHTVSKKKLSTWMHHTLDVKGSSLWHYGSSIHL